MSRGDVPACMRGSLNASLAHEDGFKAGSMGLSRDVAPERYGEAERRAWMDGWGRGRKAFR